MRAEQALVESCLLSFLRCLSIHIWKRTTPRQAAGYQRHGNNLHRLEASFGVLIRGAIEMKQDQQDFLNKEIARKPDGYLKRLGGSHSDY
ncbi:MAG: hypothetical protein C0392_09225 [Syntrophus sp. (in: bacteria)]|nr:hypothetical protein [Syntrophus sp. (in: bacteria)]